MIEAILIFMLATHIEGIGSTFWMFLILLVIIKFIRFVFWCLDD